MAKKKNSSKQAAPVATNVPNALFLKMSRFIIKAAKTSYYQGVYTKTQLMVKATKSAITYKVEQTANNNVTELYSGASREDAYNTFNKVPFSKCTYYNNRKGKDGKTYAGWVTTTGNRGKKN